MNTINPRERLIGLQACAKVVRQDGQSVEETARKAIVLYDLLAANSVRPTVLPKESSLRYQDPMTDEQAGQIETMIRDRNIDRGRFEKWLATSCSGVRELGLSGLTKAQAEQIIDRVDACLVAYTAYLREEVKKGNN